MASSNLSSLLDRSRALTRDLEANKGNYWKFNALSQQRNKLLQEIKQPFPADQGIWTHHAPPGT